MRWLVSLVGGKARRPTPIPPVKPYDDTPKSIARRGRFDPDDLSCTDVDTPHWQDPRFQSRAKPATFDMFGMNRDWSRFFFLVGCLVVPVGMLIEGTLIFTTQANTQSDDYLAATRHSAEEVAVTQKELQEAGMMVVGIKDLSDMGINR